MTISQRLLSPRLVAALLSYAPLLGAYSPTSAADLALSPYGAASPLEHACIASGGLVTGEGRRQFCIDVPPADGQKLVVSVQTAPPPLEAIRIGSTTYLRPSVNASDTAITGSTTAGPIIEVKPYLQSCERCDLCPCIGCGDRCECSCNSLCRLRREPSCAHTAGVLTPGRWYINVDAPAAFTMRATLVAALALRAGETLSPRTLFGTGATQSLRDAAASEGASFSDYFFYDPAPHESLTVEVELLRAGAHSAAIDVYVRYAEWPTSELHDARMVVNAASRTPQATFVLRADRLLNERLCVLVVARGDSWVQYAVKTNAEPSRRLVAALLIVLSVLLAALGALWRIRMQRSLAAGKTGPLIAAE